MDLEICVLKLLHRYKKHPTYPYETFFCRNEQNLRMCLFLKILRGKGYARLLDTQEYTRTGGGHQNAFFFEMFKVLSN